MGNFDFYFKNGQNDNRLKNQFLKSLKRRKIMITFKHKKDLRNDLFNLKKSCFRTRVYKYNEQKNKILESFIRENRKKSNQTL